MQVTWARFYIVTNINEGSSPGVSHSVQLSKYVSEELAASIGLLKFWNEAANFCKNNDNNHHDHHIPAVNCVFIYYI